MIRAVIDDGEIRPLDPFPADWPDGRHVIVDEVDCDTYDLVEWYRELQLMGSAEYDPGEWEEVQALLDEADENAEALVRREMGQ